VRMAEVAARPLVQANAMVQTIQNGNVLLGVAAPAGGVLPAEGVGIDWPPVCCPPGRRSTALVAVDGVDHALAVGGIRRSPTRPAGVDDVGRSIHVLGVPRAKGDRIGALDVWCRRVLVRAQQPARRSLPLPMRLLE